MRSTSSPSCTSGSTGAAGPCSTEGSIGSCGSTPASCPDFRDDTQAIREGDWTVGAIPADLQDRRVEITGPTNAKMVINALNSGAKVFMADFEDATAPVWDELVQGQVNLRDYWLGRLDFTDPDSGKHYAVGDNPAVLMVRPRGWHLPEAHVTVDGEPIAGALFDFGLYLWHNARRSLGAGSGPYFYLPKLESMEEAALWSDVFAFAEHKLRLERGTIKATVLIETLPGRLRDGRDPLRAQRQYRRPQLRPLGLYLQLHQAARPLARAADPRPLGDDHGSAPSSRLTRCA